MAASFIAMVNNPPPVFDYSNDCTEDDIDQKMAASFVVMDHNHPPVFDSNPKNEQLPLDHEQVAEESGDNNGLNLAKDCTYSCFLVTKKKCNHKVLNVQINNLGDFVLFQSVWYYQGYFKEHGDMIYITAQLFARPSIDPDCERLPQSFVETQEYIEGNLGKSMVARLSNDIVHNWDTKSSHELFPPCKKFEGDIDKEFNHLIFCKKFHQLPLLKELIDTFEKLFPYLSIDMVWLLIKSKPGAGFQRRHKDFAIGNKITKTIVINLFKMKRCDLLGGPDCFFNISDNDEGNKADEPSLVDDNNNALS
jgi:hypothetical protein